MRNFARFVLKLFGWTVIGEVPENIKKAVVIGAPHTSNWDFPIGYVAYLGLGVRAKFLMKKELFFFPMSYIFKFLGGIPVERRKKNSVVEDVVAQINESKVFYLTIAPEATRSKVEKWKDGFYRISRMADIPLIVGFIDYGKKEVGIIGEFKLSENIDDDMQKIKAYYNKSMAKYPEKF